MRLWRHCKAVNGMTILGLHFGEPGKGKSICDQYFAILKALVNRAIVTGKKADTPESFAKALCYGEGVANTIIQLGQIKNALEEEKKKSESILSEISKYHEFLFSDEGIKARYLPGFGEGKDFKIDPKVLDAHSAPRFVYEIVIKDKLTENLQCKKKSKPLPYKEEGQVLQGVKGGFGDIGDDLDIDTLESDEEDSDDEEKETLLYKCKLTPGCIKTFRRNIDYQNHKRELCLVPEVKQSSRNQLVARYIAKNGISHQYQSKTYQETRSTIFSTEILPAIDPIFLHGEHKENLVKGHAIAQTRKSVTFTKEQREFLTEKFLAGVGLQKHKKKRAQQVAKEMHLSFKRNEWLTETQIQQFFARLAAKQRSRDPTKPEFTKEELANAIVPDEQVANALNYIEAVNELQLATRIEQDLELDDEIDRTHPFLINELRLCVLAKDMKECSVFQKTKIFKQSKKKLFEAMEAAGIFIPPKPTKEVLGKVLMAYIEENCDCLTFVL